MKLSARFAVSASQMNNDILNAFLPEIKKEFSLGVSIVKQQLPSIIKDSILRSPTYDSLVSGDLKFEFGIPDATIKVAELINVWLSGIVYDIKLPSVSGYGIKASFAARAVKADFSDVLGSNAAFVHDNIGSYDLPWLQWLLLDGGAIIVPGYSVTYLPSHRSRTGNAIMTPGGNWGVASQFKGTINNNWITEAIEASNSELNLLLERTFT